MQFSIHINRTAHVYSDFIDCRSKKLRTIAYVVLVRDTLNVSMKNLIMFVYSFLVKSINIIKSLSNINKPTIVTVI